MNVHEKLSAPLRGAEHYNQIDPSANVRKTLDTTFEHWNTRVESAKRIKSDLILLDLSMPVENQP
jgi:hypothetical protein